MAAAVAETVQADDTLTPASRHPRAITSLTRVRRLPALIAHWLAPDAGDVVTLRRLTPARSVSDVTGGRHDLAAPLHGFSRAVALWRIVAVLRRWLIVALVLALVLGLVRWLIWPVPVWAVLAFPFAVMAAGAILSALQSPGLGVVARLLDRQLALKDQVSSALETPRTTGNPLVPRLQARAVTLAAQARGKWRASPVPADAEWVVLFLGIVTLAALLALARPASTVAHRSTAPPAHRTGATHLRGIRTTVVGIPSINSSAPPAVPPRIARRLAIQARSRQQPGQQSKSGVKKRGKQKGGVIPPGRASQASFPSKQGAPGAAKGGQAAGKQSGSQLQTSRRTVAGSRSRAGGAKSSGSGRTVSIKGPRLSGANGGAASRRTPGGNASKIGGGLGGGLKGQRNPYGPTPGYLRHPPKPGLVTGPGISSSGPTHGSNTAGRGRGSNGRAASHPLPGAKGRQLQLKSAYGSSAGSTQKTGPASPGNQHRTAHVQGGQGGTGAGDYIPPDANTTGWDNGPIVARYFTPSGKR